MTAPQQRVFAALVVAGVIIRIAAALLTTNSQDVALFGYIVAQGAQGHSLYEDPVFSYPPLVGYVWLGLGKLLAAVGIPIIVHAAPLAPFAVPGLVSADLTTPVTSLFIKAPPMLADAALAFVVDRACLRAGATDKERRLAVLAVWLNPLVVFNSAVQANWDAVVPLSVIAAGTAALGGESAAAGGWLAFGMVAKIVPVAFVPLVAAALGRTGSVVRRCASALAFGALLAAICLVPIGAPGGLLGAGDAAAARSSSTIIGGFNAWTALDTYALASVDRWVIAHGQLITTIADFVQLVCIVAVALAFMRAPSPTLQRWLLAAIASFATILIAAPYVQPGYAVWIVPLCAILGATGKPQWKAVAYLASASALAFVLSVRAPAALVAPACWFFHLCDPIAFANSAHTYAYAPGTFTPLEQVDAGFMLGLIGTLVFVFATWLAFVDWRRLRDA